MRTTTLLNRFVEEGRSKQRSEAQEIPEIIEYIHFKNEEFDSLKCYKYYQRFNTNTFYYEGIW